MRASRAMILALLCGFTILAAVRAPKKIPPKPAKAVKPKISPVVQKWMRSMTLRDKVAQLVVMPCYGEAITTRSAVHPRSVHQLRHLHIGCLIVLVHSPR